MNALELKRELTKTVPKRPKARKPPDRLAISEVAARAAGDAISIQSGRDKSQDKQPKISETGGILRIILRLVSRCPPKGTSLLPVKKSVCKTADGTRSPVETTATRVAAKNWIQVVKDSARLITSQDRASASGDTDVSINPTATSDSTLGHKQDGEGENNDSHVELVEIIDIDGDGTGENQMNKGRIVFEIPELDLSLYKVKRCIANITGITEPKYTSRGIFGRSPRKNGTRDVSWQLYTRCKLVAVCARNSEAVEDRTELVEGEIMEKALTLLDGRHRRRVVSRVGEVRPS